MAGACREFVDGVSAADSEHPRLLPFDSRVLRQPPLRRQRFTLQIIV